MRVLRFLRRSPLLLLGAVALAFAAWVAYDMAPADPAAGPPPPLDAVPLTLKAAPVSLDIPGGSAAPGGPQVVTHQMVAQLQPGMLRSEVEAVIGPPPAALVQPVTEVDGKFVYRTTYLANLDTPCPAAPAGPLAKPLPPPPAPAVKTLIALEFDATLPGHPLIKVHPTGPKVI